MKQLEIRRISGEFFVYYSYTGTCDWIKTPCDRGHGQFRSRWVSFTEKIPDLFTEHYFVIGFQHFSIIEAKQLMFMFLKIRNADSRFSYLNCFTLDGKKVHFDDYRAGAASVFPESIQTTIGRKEKDAIAIHGRVE